MDLREHRRVDGMRRGPALCGGCSRPCRESRRVARSAGSERERRKQALSDEQGRDREAEESGGSERSTVACGTRLRSVGHTSDKRGGPLITPSTVPLI